MRTYRILVNYKENGKWKYFHDIVSECNVTEAINVCKGANHYEFNHMEAYIERIWIEREYAWEEIDF